jgi:hypothetical protein
MKFLCGVAGYMPTDHQRNTEIRKKLEVFNLILNIQNYKNNFLLHLKGTEDHGIDKQAS